MNVADNPTEDAALVSSIATDENLLSGEEALVHENAQNFLSEALFLFLVTLCVFDGVFEAFKQKVIRVGLHFGIQQLLLLLRQQKKLVPSKLPFDAGDALLQRRN